MTPADFIQKWGDSTLRERQGAQEHFIDLCRLLGEPTPAEDDPLGDHYCFERGAGKTGGGDGWADVWRRGCFGWEYKGKHKNLSAALRQLQAYALDLQNPPYLVVCDMERIVVHTNWTNTVSRRYDFGLDDLRVPARLDQLRAVFRGSESLKPNVSPQDLTAAAAARFGELGRRLQERGHPPRAVAHFLNRVIFCLFAEHAGLLPPKLFTRMIKGMQIRPRLAQAQFEELFAKMGSGGFFGADVVLWFNGGLFDDTGALPLNYEDLKLIGESAAEHDWSQIDPAIFGTLFEEALKATRQRAALGAHYTDRAKILKIVEPVIVRPLMAEWDAAAAGIAAAVAEARAVDEERRRVMERVAASLEATGAEAVLAGERGRAAATAENLELFEDVGAARLPGAAGRAMKKAQPELVVIARRRLAAVDRARDIRDGFLSRLASFRVLDPACGSGNFLYVALHALRDIELRALMDAERLGIPQVAPRVGLDALRGIEIEPYAAELARVTLWIGNLQWEKKNGYTAYAEPVLATLDGIENRDALLDPDGSEADWPEADAIIGNPPFLGGKRLRTGLGDAAVERLFKAYKGRVPAEADFVCYWVEKAWRRGRGPGRGAALRRRPQGRARHHQFHPRRREPQGAGADRGGRCPARSLGRRALGVGGRGRPCFDDRVRVGDRGAPAGRSGGRADQRRPERGGRGPDAGEAAQGERRRRLHGRHQGGRLRRSRRTRAAMAQSAAQPERTTQQRRAQALAQRHGHHASDNWIIDFGWTMSEQEAALYEAPFRHALIHVQPERSRNNRESYRCNWWRHVEARSRLRRKTSEMTRYLATPRVARHRLFIWLKSSIIPDSRIFAFVRSEDLIFGILVSKAHQSWSLRTASWHGVGNDPTYNSESCFETFPFPEGLTPNIPATTYADDPRAKAIAEAAAELNRLRENWLNPPDLVRVEPEVVPGYPDRILPRDAEAAAVLKTRTLTNLYNARPAWLDMAHRRLDAAVASAYGWPADLADDAILERLFALNQERAAAGR